MNSAWRFAAFGAVAAAVSLVVFVGACGESRKVEGGVTPGSELNFEIQAVTMPAAGATTGPTLTFRATDRNGNPIDLLAELANTSAKTIPYISNGPRFTLSQLNADGSETSLYEATRPSAAFTAPDATSPTNPNRTAVQPIAQPGQPAEPAGTTAASRLTAQGNGVYVFQFAKPTTDASKLDAGGPKTLAAAMYGERIQNRPNGGPKRWPAAASGTFAGASGGTPAAQYQTVTDQSCGRCHVVLRAHDRRQSVQLCKTCHTGGGDVLGVNPGYRDPDSNESIDFRVMIHRIHNGMNLPSVLAGGSFFIVGFQQSVSDFSDAFFPATRDPRECTVCHAGGPNSDDWKNKASFVACTACHDEIRFDGSADHGCALAVHDVQPCNHLGSPSAITASSNCATCHQAGATSPNLGPDVVHANPIPGQVAPWKYEITSVTPGTDRKPIVQFRVTKDGAPQDILNATEWKQGAASRLFVDIAWPTQEFTNDGAGYVEATIPGQGQPVQISALPGTGPTGAPGATPVPGQTNVFQIVSPTAVPPQFSSIRVVLEGHPALGLGSTAIRVPVPNAVQDVAMGGGTPTARRQIVSADTCNTCHEELSAHGSNRNATPDVCVVCHTPRTTDYIRWVQAGRPADPPEEPIDFKVLVHEIHGADIRLNDVTILGFPSGTPPTPSKNDFPAAFPGETGRCTICHVDDSYRLPFKPEVLDTTIAVGDPAAENDPAEQQLGKTQAVCTACHDAVHFDSGTSRPTCNTLIPVNSADCNHTGGPMAGDTQCAGCHGTGGPNDVARVHAIQDQPQ